MALCVSSCMPTHCLESKTSHVPCTPGTAWFACLSSVTRTRLEAT